MQIGIICDTIAIVFNDFTSRTMSKYSLQLWDKIGMCTSVVCMVHCMAIPILFIFGSETLLRMIDQEWVEWSIILFALLIGLVAFINGFVTHRQHFIPVLFVSGFLLLVNGESVATEWISLGLSLSGASVIAYAHFQNLKWKRYAYTS